MYSDTLFATTVIRRGNRCKQVFATFSGNTCSSKAQKWSPLYIVPFLSEGQHDACNVLWQCWRNDSWWIQQKTQEGIQSPNIDWAVHSMVKCSWNIDKGNKNGSSSKLVKSGSPKRLWDYLLEVELYIRSNTAHSICKLDGEVPEKNYNGKDFWYNPVLWVLVVQMGDVSRQNDMVSGQSL